MSPSIVNPSAVTGINYPALNGGGQWFKCIGKKMTVPELNVAEGDFICVGMHGNISDGDLVTYNPEDDEVFPIMRVSFSEDGYMLAPVNDDAQQIKITRQEMGDSQLQDLGIEKIVRVMKLL